MSEKKKQQTDRLEAYARLIERQMGKAVRPYRTDGFMNLLTRYGTSKDSSTHFHFQAEPTIPDDSLTIFYEGNGLFAKIIDAPAEEAMKHGFKLDDISDTEIENFYQEALDELDWEETAMTALKWMRLFGGSIIVMLINDGRGLEEPLDWKNIKSIDDLRVYDRSVIQPEYETMFSYSPDDPFRTRGSRLGMPERYHVYSRFGSFVVHESRCLVFQNGTLPENTTNSIYQFWGLPEYIRIHRAIQDAEVAHRSAPKMLDKSVQPIYKMKDLAMELSTEEGESKVLRRLQTIDMARGMLNSITIDSEGEDYDFRTFQFSGVSDVIDSACNFLSALTSIPQTILFGRSPAGMNATGESDLENWYSYVERIRKRNVKGNLRYLLSIIFRAGVRSGEVDEMPDIKIKFDPLWSLSELEQANLDKVKADIEMVKAQTIQTYVGMDVLDPSEIRRKLADSSEFEIETMLDEYDNEEDLMSAYGGNPDEMMVDPATGQKIFEEGHFSKYAPKASINGHDTNPGTEGSAPANAPAATKLPQDMSAQEKAEVEENAPKTEHGDEKPQSVAVLVIKDGKILTGTRHNDFGYGLICGPGGHVEKGETPEQAAFRETEEEFGISPTELIEYGIGPEEPDTGLTPTLFMCTDYNGEPDCMDMEMTAPQFRTLEEIEQLAPSLFQPFKDAVDIFVKTLTEPEPPHDDGGPGSGNHGHKGVPGEIGGSLPNGGDSGLSTMNRVEGAKVLAKFGAGTQVKITKKNGSVVEFTKLEDDKWSRSDQPEHTYQDVGVASNCWKAEVEVKAKQSEKPDDKRAATETAKESAEKLAEENERTVPEPRNGKYAELDKKAKSISGADMSADEKANAAKAMIRDVEPGTTFKLGGVEYQKTDDPDYPYQALNRIGEPIRGFSEESIAYEVGYYGSKENGIEFFDKSAQVAEWSATAKQMKDSGKYSTSDAVHKERPGKITDTSDDFGQEGDYVVYRNGAISSSGMIFFSPKKEGADTYASGHDNGNTSEYEVNLKNPLVIKGETDVECIRKAYEALHPGKKASDMMTASKWISYDKANATALNKGESGHDSIVYVVAGKPKEVQITAKKAKSGLSKTAEYTTTKWSRSGLTYEEAAQMGYITGEVDDYKRVDAKSDSFHDDGIMCSYMVYDSLLNGRQPFSTDYLFPNISEKPIDKCSDSATITVKETSEDGAPHGNNNAAGPHKRQHLSSADKERYSKRIVGQTTSDGVKVTGFSGHAFDRIAQRNLSPKRIEDMLSSSEVSPDKNHPTRRCYDTKGSRLVLDYTNGTIVTIEWRSQNK